ncbi:CYTH domain-containing protein [Actinacidiphila paucisporea]|uniref:Adenylate cyclase, class 2 n=1 Tax=Actinacidiphila paucisporea TaxID=310782 RepID=A0A1M7BWS0_9ACTN|nr:CYTH domain-containing protein [Actinacidiphila paucisporea]SHL59377.1 adenylate cyclase, class 2 [Actinacidiphila paucisporea]
MAQVEFEMRALEVDTADIARRIAAAGGEHVADRLMRRFVYDIRPGEQGRWMRLRDTGSEVTLCVKEISDDAVDGTRETETTVGDFDVTHELLGLLGFQPKAYQENRRSSWLLDGVRLEIDSWPRIPPYLEIEADDADQVWATADRLALPRHALTGANTTALYASYGIDLAGISDLRFAD